MLNPNDAQGNGKITDENLMKISPAIIEDPKKYSDEDRKRHAELFAKARLERYTKDPNSFIETKAEVVACCIRSPWGQMIFIQGHKQELQIAWAELNRKIMDKLRMIDLEMAMKKKPMIQRAGQFLSGLRGRKH